MRHDLRGAIAPMRMAVQLLRDKRVEATEREQALQVIERQLEQLLAAAEDIGDLLRVQAGSLTLHSASQDANLLLDVLCGRGVLLRELAGHKLSLRCEPCAEEVTVAHDPLRVTSILEFLLMRMAAHAAPGGELLVSLRREGGASLLLSGASHSLAGDPELATLLGRGAVGEEASLRALLVRALLAAAAIELQEAGAGALRLRFNAGATQEQRAFS